MSQKKHNAWTLAATGVVTFYVIIMAHEVLGHSLFAYLCGAHHFLLTSTSMDWDDDVLALHPDRPLGKLLLASGAWMDFLIGGAAYFLLRSATRKGAPVYQRYILWLAAVCGLSDWPTYMIFSSFSNFGDWFWMLEGMLHPGLWRAGMVCLGLLLLVVLSRALARQLATFPESLSRLTWIPYVAIMAVFSFAAIYNPLHWQMVLLSAFPSTAMGNILLAFLAPMARKIGNRPTSEEQIGFQPAALCLCALAIVVLLLTAPGIHWTAPAL